MARRRSSPLDRILGRIDDLDAQNLAILARRLERERDLMETVLDAALGQIGHASLVPQPTAEPFGHSRFVIPAAPGRITRADPGAVDQLPGVHDVGFFHHAGQIVPPLWSFAPSVTASTWAGPGFAPPQSTRNASLIAL